MRPSACDHAQTLNAANRYGVRALKRRDTMIDIFHASATILMLTVFLCLYRVLAGPGVGNRLIAVNTIGTKTVVLLVLIGFIYERPLFLDISIVYAMINFIATLAIAKYLGRGHIC